jgi:phage tail tape-measure protein
MSKTDEKKKLSEEEVLKEKAESGQRVSGEPDSNLAAVGGGGIAGAAGGAAIGGVIGGPVGAAIGAAAGAVAGAAAADQIQDELDPKLEEAYWQENYRNQPYYKSGAKYESYLPAYRFGWESASRPEYSERDFEEVEPELRKNWEGDWDAVRAVVRDSFMRVRLRRKIVR